MVENALQNTIYMNDDNTFTIIILIIAAIFFGAVFFFSKSTRSKIGAAGCFILFLWLGIGQIIQNGSMAKAINNGDWEMHTDVVDRVMESTDNDGDKDYFMVLEKYGRISLDGYSEATDYYSGQQVYIVVIRTGSSYEKTGITYPADVYEYIGNH